MFRQAPGASLVFSTWHDAVFGDVERGIVDLAFSGFRADKGLRSELLYEERFVCLLADDHPLAGRKSLALKEFLGAAHVVVSIRGGEQSAIDRTLTGLGERRTASLTVPYHSTAAQAVSGTPLVATLPARMLPDTVDPGPGLSPPPRRSPPCRT